MAVELLTFFLLFYLFSIWFQYIITFSSSPPLYFLSFFNFSSSRRSPEIQSISLYFSPVAGDSIGKFINRLWIAEANPFQHRRPPPPSPPSTTNFRFFSFQLSFRILHSLLLHLGYDTSRSVFPEDSRRYID